MSSEWKPKKCPVCHDPMTILDYLSTDDKEQLVDHILGGSRNCPLRWVVKKSEWVRRTE